MQILGHVVWFKMAIEELNSRIQELASEIRNSGDMDTVRESADLIGKYSQLLLHLWRWFRNCVEAKYDPSLYHAPS